jgi:hypothetical protein
MAADAAECKAPMQAGHILDLKLRLLANASELADDSRDRYRFSKGSHAKNY